MGPDGCKGRDRDCREHSEREECSTTGISLPNHERNDHDHIQTGKANAKSAKESTQKRGYWSRWTTQLKSKRLAGRSLPSKATDLFSET